MYKRQAYGYQLGVKHRYREGWFDQVDRVLYDLRHDPASRRILAVQPHEALLLMEEVSYTKLAKPVMYSLSYYTAFFDFALLRKKF